MSPTEEPAALRRQPVLPRWSVVLRALREARGVTQEGWAAQIGVSRTTVLRWERGERAPDPGAEAAILAYCRERDLFRGYDRGPLAGLALSAELLRDLLAEARWRVGGGPADVASSSDPPAIVQSNGALHNASRPSPSNVPTQLSSFVGREQEIASVRRALGGTRLLTLTGAGGCGKTRLALQVAGELLWAYPHGTWLVELAALTDAALVPRTVAAALGLPPMEPRPPVEALTDFLRPRSLLLVLDNCEHLLAACAELVEALLRTCPNLEALATSREPLSIGGEAVWQVPPMALPPVAWESDVGAWRQRPDDPPPTSDAVRLFVERARFRRPEFELTPQNAAAVAEVCRRLDGIPLAIELAAARVTALSAGEIAARLGDRFHLLTGGSRTALPRQQTLRATLDWSHDLLTAPERTLLRRLAVFAGGFTLAAAAVVADAADDTPRVGAADVLDLLTRLVDQSLVVADEQAGAVRYRMLETVRQYASEQLTVAGEARVMRERHGLWCLALAEAAEPHRAGPEQGEWLERLTVEHDNLRAALGWCLTDEGNTTVGLRLGAAVWWFWLVRGHLGEGRHWLAALLTRGGDAPPDARAKALSGAGLLAADLGDYDEATRLHEESVALRRELGDDAGVASALTNLGMVALVRGDLPSARALFAESLTVGRTVGDPSLIAKALNNLGVVARQAGEPDQAAARYEESLAVMRGLGDTRNIAIALLNLGNVHQDQGAPELAVVRYRESLSLCGELQDRRGAASCLQGLAAVAVTQGDAARAARLCGAATAVRAATGVQVAAFGRAKLERTTAAARAALGETDFAATWAAGHALSLEKAIADALSDTAPA